MSKDPAILFYTSDFLAGTYTFTDEQVGKYMRLLCLQHQKGGFLTEKDMMSICKTYDIDIWSKFKKVGDSFFNQRMKEEAEKRANYSESRRNNRLKKEIEEPKQKDMNNICKSYDKHMENENINENINKDKKEILRERARKFKVEVYSFIEYPPGMLKEFFQYWIEPNKSFTKMRYELQKTWELKLRLIKWASNQKDFKKQEVNSHVMPSKNIGGSNYSATKRNTKEPALLGIILDKAKELNIN
jgi:uncharacterized protein YdaU (DUF1376 family)